MFDRILALLQKKPYLSLVAALVLAVLSVRQGMDLPLRLSLSDLLPEDSSSVRELKAVAEDVGGEGFLITLIGPTEKPEQYLEPLASALRKSPDIKYVSYQRDEYVLRDKALYLLPRDDFDKMLSSIDTLYLDPKKNPLNIGLFDDSPDEVEQSKERARAFLNSLGRRTGNGGSSQYYLSKDGRSAMLIAKPSFDSGELGKASDLLDFAHQAAAEALSNVPVQFLGRYVSKVHDTRQIQEDIKLTSAISVVGVGLLLVLGLGSLRAALINITLVSLAMAWTLGFARLFVGQINILTGFLLAILGGLGVEYGVHLMRRYNQERSEGKDHEAAFAVTYNHIGRALLSAAITSSAAFLILSFSEFRGFSELGKIAGFGILAIYGIYMLAFPAASRLFRTRNAHKSRWANIFGYYPVTLKWKWALLPFALVCAWGFSRAEFEYNFKRMHNLSAETQRLNLLADELFGRSLAPAAILAKDADQAREMAEWFGDESRKEVVHSVVSLHNILNEDMNERSDALGGFRRYIAKNKLGNVEKETGLSEKDIRTWFKTEPYTRGDMPDQVRDSFGKSGNIVAVYPAKDYDLVENLHEFAGLLKEAHKKFPGMQIGSEVTVFSQILHHVIYDGRIVLLIFLIGSFFVLWLDFRNLRDALDLELQLIFGIVLLICLMGLVGERFSILNVAMVPAVLAAGIDMGVHVRHRELEGFSPLAAVRYVAQAVQLSALTTIVGFGSLFFAEAGILKGIAWISVLGQVSMYLVCMVIRPLVKECYLQRVA